MASDNKLALLAMTSKIMYDIEIIELHKEIEDLKLQLFWKDYCIEKLKKTLIDANKYHPDSPYCDCYNCIACKRAYIHSSAENPKICLFKEWFENVLNIYDLNFIKGYPNNNPEEIIHMSNNSIGSFVLDVDTHLINMGQLNWFSVTYGSKLFKATTINNPELQKLKKLFMYLTIE